ncbi:hypothetical protein VNI00_005439 [Paramarasmius palmivorus]|uniref:Uncharacterized protein n=1 Tax=Paramarasmius palmivorus TaxID=297713 RepID=A0AAW0DBK7_9AGAR
MNDKPSLAHLASEKYVEEVAKGAGEKTVEYATDDPEKRMAEAQQRADEAKEQARPYKGQDVSPRSPANCLLSFMLTSSSDSSLARETSIGSHEALHFPLHVNNVTEAAQFLLWYLENVRKEGGKEALPWLSDCKLLLYEHPELYAVVKDAHSMQDFTKLDQSDLLHRCRVRWSSQFKESREILEGLSVAGTMPLLSNGERWLAYGFWVPTPNTTRSTTHSDSSPSNRDQDLASTEHIRAMRILAAQVNPTQKCPNMCLHDLGHFHEDPILRERLAKIFHRSNTFLVNVAGSGKSRLLYEGLCIRWGLLLSVFQAQHVWPLTIGDLHCVLRDSDWCGVKALDQSQNWTEIVPRDDTSFLETNLKLAHRRFSEVLLSRLLTFQEFMRNIGSGREYKRSWLEMQLHQPDERPLEHLYAALQKANVDDRVINDAVAKSLEEIFAVLDLPEGERFYIVVDQAEEATYAQWDYRPLSHFKAFRDENGENYPILKEMLRCWHAHMRAFPVSFVVSGREIQREFFTGEEWSSYSWTSNTGSFDGGEDQRGYLARYLPPGLASPAKEEFLDRACRLLAGRYRITADFVAYMLSTNYRESCDRLLTRFVFALCRGLNYRDPMANNFHPEEKLVYGSRDRADIHYSLLHALCFAQCLTGSLCDNVNLVANGYGRFTDANMSTIAIDEIPTIGRAAYWFDATDSYTHCDRGEARRSLTDIDYFVQKIFPDIKGPQKDHHITCHIATCLAVLFERPIRMWDLLSFPLPTPRWAGQSSALVTRQQTSKIMLHITPFRFTQRTHRALVTRSRNLSDLAAWLEGSEESTPFVLHSTDSGEVLMFCLQMEGTELFWVFLKVATHASGEEMSPSDLAQCYESMDPAVLFANKKDDDPDIVSLLKGLPNKCPGTGPYGVLRVVVPFNANTDINERSFVANGNSVALLSTDVLQRYVSGNQIVGEAIAQEVLFALTGEREFLGQYSLSDTFRGRLYRHPWWDNVPEAPQPSQASSSLRPKAKPKPTKAATTAAKRKRRSATAVDEGLGQTGEAEDEDSGPPSKRLRSKAKRRI